MRHEHNVRTEKGRAAMLKELMAYGNISEGDAKATVERYVANAKANEVEARRVRRSRAKDGLPPINARDEPVISEENGDVLGGIMPMAQIPFWVEEVRSQPNEIGRSALFTCKNRSTAREDLKDKVIYSIGDGVITYRGEELRQFDQTVWMQLVHMGRTQDIGAVIEFTSGAFLKEIGCPANGQYYQRLEKSLSRLTATKLSVYSNRLKTTISLSMLPYTKCSDKYDANGKKTVGRSLWQVKLPPELIRLFSGGHYSRIQWQQRLKLNNEVAQWLHGYYATHEKPHPVLLDTIKDACGLRVSGAELRRSISRAADALVAVGFLENYDISNDKLSVERAVFACDDTKSW